ncbi:MAG: phosphodiester glycosidase family protein, partial [Cyanobacteria bacterium J06626_18]
RREVHEVPWPYIVHVVQIDLTTPGIDVQVSSGNSAGDDFETTAQTVSDFLTDNDLQLAVNAHFFYPFREKTPWNFYPQTGDRVNVVGQAIAEGVAYSPPRPAWPVLCFAADNRARVAVGGSCPTDTQQAITGSELLVMNGKTVPPLGKDLPYARVAVAIDAVGEQLWLIVVDGKQPHYSQGVTLTQLGQIAVELGADSALNLDGGGSTTLVAATSTGPAVLNAPIHTRLPLRERPVATQLGFRANTVGSEQPGRVLSEGIGISR